MRPFATFFLSPPGSISWTTLSLCFARRRTVLCCSENSLILSLILDSEYAEKFQGYIFLLGDRMFCAAGTILPYYTLLKRSVKDDADEKYYVAVACTNNSGRTLLQCFFFLEHV